jgi:hypothetical protein
VVRRAWSSWHWRLARVHPCKCRVVIKHAVLSTTHDRTARVPSRRANMSTVVAAAGCGITDQNRAAVENGDRVEGVGNLLHAGKSGRCGARGAEPVTPDVRATPDAPSLTRPATSTQTGAQPRTGAMRACGTPRPGHRLCRLRACASGKVRATRTGPSIGSQRGSRLISRLCGSSVQRLHRCPLNNAHTRPYSHVPG